MERVTKPEILKEFPAVTTEEWEARIVEDLKGADYEKRLVWKTTEGLAVRPYYREEDLAGLEHMDVLPGQAPYVRGSKTGGNNWDVRQDIEEEDAAVANLMARKAVEGGVQALGLNVAAIDSAQQFGTLLEGLDPEKTSLHFLNAKDHKSLLDWLIAQAGNKQAGGSLNADPLGDYLLFGKACGSPEDNMEKLADLLREAKAKLPNYRVITVNGQHYHNAGASIVQELAFTLAQANEYLACLTDKGFSADEAAAAMQLTLAAGSSYFLEIAKFRAIKMLWAKVVEAYGQKQAPPVKLHAVTSDWNKTIYDPYVNLLRTTTEAMAASIGGVDSMSVKPFDSTWKKPDAFSLRVARNQQIVLKHEAYFNKVADPAAGSYYVENLTASLARAAWELFVNTEQQGGFLSVADNGFITNALQETCQRRDIDIALRKQVFVGTNQYPNTGERMLDKLKPIVRPEALGRLRPYRGAQAFEALRLAVENHEKKGFSTPKVFLLTYGNLAMRKARAGFSTNFFGVAGYQVEEWSGSKEPLDGAREALDKKADIVVLCSSDEEYPELAPTATMIKKQSPNTRVVVAGNPKEHIELLDKAGVDYYIHMRTNVLEALRRFNEILEIH
jgi:methylmalonyl-CoA mutase